MFVRTTLDLDDRVLALAKSRAQARGISLGKAVSELVLEGYEAQASAAEIVGNGFPMLPRVPGHVITDDMVAAALTEV